MSIDQQFVEFVIKSLVSKPDKVIVERRIDEKGVLLELTVDPEDLGRVIGKRGATAQSVRTLLRALGTKNDARYNLKIVDNGPNPSHGGSRNDDSSKPSGGLWGDDKDAPVSDEAKQVIEEAVEEVAETPAEENKEDAFSRTRKELADLDDLDL